MPSKGSLADPLIPPPSPTTHDTIPVAHYPMDGTSTPASPKEAVTSSGYTQLPAGPKAAAAPKQRRRRATRGIMSWPWASLVSLTMLLVGVGLLLTAPAPNRTYLGHHLPLVNVTGLSDTWKGVSDQAAAALEQWVTYMQAGDAGGTPVRGTNRRAGSMAGWDLTTGGVSTELETLLLVEPAFEVLGPLPEVPAGTTGQEVLPADYADPLEDPYDHGSLLSFTPAAVEDQGQDSVTTASVSLSLADELALQEVIGDGVIADITMGGVVTEVRHLRGGAVSATGDIAEPGVPAMNPPVLDDLLVTVNLPGDVAGESTMSVQIPLDGQVPADVVTVEVTATTSDPAASQAGSVHSDPLSSVSVSVDLLQEVDQLLVSVAVPGSYLEMAVPTADPESASAASNVAGGQAPDEGFKAAAAFAHGLIQQNAEVLAGQVEEGDGLFDITEGDYFDWLGYDDEEGGVDAAVDEAQATDNEGRLLPTSEQLVQEVFGGAGEPSPVDAQQRQQQQQQQQQQEAPGSLAVHHRPLYRSQAASGVYTAGGSVDLDLVNPVLVNSQQYREPPVDYLEQLGVERLEGALGADDITAYTSEDLAGVSEHLDTPLDFLAGDAQADDLYSADTAGDAGSVMAYGVQVPADAVAESISGLFMGRRRLRQAVRIAPAPPSPPVVAPVSPKPGPTPKSPPPAKVAPSSPPPAKPQSPPPAKPVNLSPPPPSVILIDPMPPSPPAPSPVVTPATPDVTPAPGTTTNGTVVLPADPNAPVLVPADTSNTTKTNSTSLVPTEEQAKEVETKLASEAAAARQPEPVTVTMDMRGVLPETFNSVAPSILRVLSNLAGVSDPWSLFGLAPLTTVTGVTPSGRHLLQSPGQVIGVRALYLMNTTSSKLVAFRLAQPLGTAGGGTSSDTGCRTVLCQQLVAAGVPVDVSSILVVPDGLAIFSEVQEASDAEAAQAAATFLRNTIIAAVVAGVGGLLLLLLAWKLLPACYRRCLSSKTEAKTLPMVRPHGRRSTNGSDFSFSKGSRVLVVQHSNTSRRSASFALEAIAASPQQQGVATTGAQTEELSLDDPEQLQQQQKVEMVEAVKGTVTNVRPVAAGASARTVYGKMGSAGSVSSHNSGTRIMTLFAPPVADFEDGEHTGSTCTWSDGPSSPVGSTTDVLPTLSPHGTASHMGRAGSGPTPPGSRSFFTPGPSPTSGDGAALNHTFNPARTVNTSGQTSRRTSGTAAALAPPTPAGPTRAGNSVTGVATANFSMRPVPLSPRASGIFTHLQGTPVVPPAAAAPVDVAGGNTHEAAAAPAAGAGTGAGTSQAGLEGSRANMVQWWLSRK